MATQTQAELSGLNLKLDPVERLTFDGLQKAFLRVFKVPSVWCTSTDKPLAVKRLFGTNPIKYPYVLLTLTSVAESTDRFNTQSTARRGKIAVVSTDAKRSYRVHFLPTTFDISVEFVSNDYSQVLTFANEWLFARRNGWLKFEIAYGSTNFSISAEGEPQVSIPIREADPDNVSEYVVTSQLKLDGFISYGTLIEGQIADTIQVDGALPEGTTVWSFTGSKDNAIQQDYSPIIPVNQR